MSRRSLHILGSTLDSLHHAQLDAIELACLDCGYELIENSKPKTMFKDLAKNKNSMFITDISGLLGLLKDHKFLVNSQTIVCTQLHSEVASTQTPEILEQISNIRYLVGATIPSFMRSVLGSILEFQLTNTRGLRGLCPRLMRLENLKWNRIDLTQSQQREEISKTICDFFTEQLATHKDAVVNGTSSYPKHLSDVLDEFLMNAIWDANPLRENLIRTKPTNLEPGERIEVFYACDGLNLILAVEDSHGTFPAKAMKGPLRYALGLKDEAKINEGPGGAGLGLYMVLQKVAALSIEVQRGKKTRAIAVLRSDLSLREMQKKPRTVLLFET